MDPVFTLPITATTPIPPTTLPKTRVGHVGVAVVRQVDEELAAYSSIGEQKSIGKSL